MAGHCIGQLQLAERVTGEQHFSILKPRQHGFVFSVCRHYIAEITIKDITVVVILGLHDLVSWRPLAPIGAHGSSPSPDRPGRDSFETLH